MGLKPRLEVFESKSPLEFKVIVLGEPTPLITWKMNNNCITDLSCIKVKNNCSILTLEATESAVGLYSCTAENTEGKVETRCQLTILPKNVQNNYSDSTATNKNELKPCPPTVLDHLRCCEAEDGAAIDLTCKIVCPFSFDVVWLHNGKEIKPSKDFQYHHVDTTYNLKIPELFPEDAGIYTCEAFNDYGETFTTCSLFVTCSGSENDISAKIYKTFPKSVSVSRGAPVVVQAELESGCDRQVTWIKDGCVVDQTTMANPDSGKVQFSIIEAGLRDTGLYEMHVTKDGEDNIAAFAINVL